MVRVHVGKHNSNKTAKAIEAAVAGVNSGKTVLFISTEGREADIKERMFCTALGLSLEEFRQKALVSDPEVEAVAKKFNDSVAWLYSPPRQGEPLNLMSDVKMGVDQGFGLIVVDHVVGNQDYVVKVIEAAGIEGFVSVQAPRGVCLSNVTGAI